MANFLANNGEKESFIRGNFYEKRLEINRYCPGDVR